MLAASASRLHYYWRISSFPQRQIRWNALLTGFHWESAFVREIPNPTWIHPRKLRVTAYVWHDSFLCVTWLILICDTMYFYGRHASFVTQLCVCDVTRSGLSQSTRICVTQLIFLRDSHNDSFLCATRLICIWHDAFLWATCLVRDSFLRVRHNSFFCVTVMMTPFYVRHGLFVCVTCHISMGDIPPRSWLLCACVT